VECVLPVFCYDRPATFMRDDRHRAWLKVGGRGVCGSRITYLLWRALITTSAMSPVEGRSGFRLIARHYNPLVKLSQFDGLCHGLPK
jgi:hypothetical protein